MRQMIQKIVYRNKRNRDNFRAMSNNLVRLRSIYAINLKAAVYRCTNVIDDM